MALLFCWRADEEFGPDTSVDVVPMIPAGALDDADKHTQLTHSKATSTHFTIKSDPRAHTLTSSNRLI